MRKVFKMLLIFTTVFLSIFLLPFMVKAENKNVEIVVSAIPSNGTDEKHLMCGSSLVFAVEINSAEVDKDNADIDWTVTKKDDTSMQAVYEVKNNGANLEIYAPYGYSEELEISVCVNGNAALTDTYTLETQENEKMVGKTFFQFDIGSAGEDIICNPTTEVWNADENTYTITMPSVSLKNDCILFHGWKCSDGNIYDPGAKVTVFKKNGFMLVSAWYDILDEPAIIATKVPMYTEEPATTTGSAVTADPTEAPQESDIPEVTEKPEKTQIPSVTNVPELTQTPIATVTPEETTAPIVTEVPEVTEGPVTTTILELTQAPVVTATPEVTKVPVTIGTPEIQQTPVAISTPEIQQTPVATSTPKVTIQPTANPESYEIKTVSKITVKKAGSRKIKVSWSKVSNVKGYRIVYSTNKSFKNNSTKYKTTTATKITLTKLTKNKTYYVKVCAYKVVDGKKVYGTYSNMKSIILK